jgi:predicted alpha-1,2-mannosidase
LSFDQARARAAHAWSMALGKISTVGATAAQQEAFATALFHAETMPHDLTGDGSWPAGQSHYEDLYTLWDTYRTVNPLLTILEPAREAGIVRTLLWIDRHDGGFLPDARVATNNGITQVGSNAEIVIGDAILEGLGGFDRTAAYRAILRDAEVSSPHPGSEGRDLHDYARLGYVATDEGRSASRTLEYAYEDYVVSEVAALLGHTATAATLSRRAEDWENLWDPAQQSIVPRNAGGSFLEPFDPTQVFYGFDAPFYEGSALEWSTFVPQDVQGLVNRLGGETAAAGWLGNVMNCCYDPTNEPDLLAAYEFIQMGHPELTDYWVSRLLADYGDQPDGLPGNDDAGTLSAWYVWSAIGLYPNAGQPYYFIGSPVFTSTRIALGNGRTFTINAPDSSAQNIYVEAATLDGVALDRAFITSGELERGGTLTLQMGASPDGWGSSIAPPSLSAALPPSQ